jgi:uncharacterized OB-fold protein
MDLTAAIDAPLIPTRRRADRSAGTLVGGRCTSCGAAAWPRRAICFACGAAAIVEEEFASTGTLLTHTTVYVPRPGLDTPYTIGQVEIDDGPRVFCHVRGVRENTTVPCAVEVAFSSRDDAVPLFWFEVT